MKKRRRKAKSKAKAQVTTPTLDNPVVVEDYVEDDASSESIEHLFEAVPIQKKLSGIKIRELEVFDISSSSDKKGKKVLEEGQEVYVRNIGAHKLDFPFVNRSQADMAALFNKVIRCLLSKSNMDYLDSQDPTERTQKAEISTAEVLS